MTNAEYLEAVTNRHIMYNHQLDFVKKAETEGLVYVVQPTAPLNVGTLEKDTSKLEAIYRLGYKQGRNNAKAIKEFLSK